MKFFPTSLAQLCFGICLTIATSTLFAQEQKGSPSTAPSPILPPGTTVNTGGTTAPAGTSSAATSGAMPNEAEMMKQMMEMAKLNENHKLLASLDGTWTFVNKMWMNGDPSSKPQESKGTAVRKSRSEERRVGQECR